MTTDRNAKLAAGMSTTAAIAAVLAMTKTAKASTNGATSLPAEFVQLIVNIAVATDSLDAAMLQVLQKLDSLSMNVQGFPPNAPGIWATGITCVVAGIAYQGPDITIPEGMTLVIKNHPASPVGSIISIGENTQNAANIFSSYPLAVNDVKGYQIQNAKQLWVSSTIGGAIAVFSAEKTS